MTETTLRGDASPRSPGKADRRSLHEMLTPFPVAYFTGAFVTDLAYWQSANVMWERFSVWLIVAGLIAAIFVALAAIIDLVRGQQKPAWAHASAYVFAILLSMMNVFVHSRLHRRCADGPDAVRPRLPHPVGCDLGGLGL
jgi:uncharacterized membrane protein